MRKILHKNEWGKGGIDTFESNVTRELLEKDFESISYSKNKGNFYSEVYNRYKAAKAVEKNVERVDTVFVPDHTLMSFINPDNFNADFIPYVHDIFPVTTNFSGYISTLLGQKYVENIKKCEKIICNSNYVEQELRQRAGFRNESKTIYQGVDIEKPDKVTPYEDREHDFIYVGGMTPRKAEKELRNFASNLKDKKMVAVNRKPLDLPCEVRTGISDRELVSLLDDSRFYLHPGFHEGFGRGAVEAQRRGVPVIARDNQINNEILGTYIPLDLYRSGSQIENWDELSKASIVNSRKYKWQRTQRSIDKYL